uniref:Jacalin-type lectin domain-containing protein n=1 Tax=Oryza brachyantha TaxID=4533 RepID=J3N8Q7_ORYBR
METAAAAVVSASTGALNTLLPKLADLLLVAGGGGGQQRRGRLSEAPPEQLDGQVRLWARDVRDMSYDAEDAIDAYVALREASRPPTASCSCVGGLTRGRSHRRAIAAEIERIRKEVEEVSRRRARYEIDRVVVDAAATSAQQVDRRLPALYANAASLVGVDGSVEQVIKLLAMEGEDAPARRKLKLVAIVGPGGIGKTTLANLVYQKLHGQFECRAFVSVSLNPNIKAVLSSILCQVSHLNHENFSSWSEKEVIDKIRDVLQDNRYFIIFDDIWNEPTWKLLKCVLIDNDRGGKIIATTRNIDVAEFCCNYDYIDGNIYELQPLCVADSEKLLYRKVFHNERCPPQLRGISQKILKICGGLPLAIVTIASLFANRQTQREDHWETDYSIERDNLIWIWIAEGFIQPRQDRSLYEQGERYFDELINRNLIQPICVDVHGKAQACHVHDTILEFVTYLSKEEKFVSISNGQCSLSHLPKKIYRLSLKNSKDDFRIPHATESFSHVRSLIAISWQGIDLKMSLSGFRVLRVLDLGDCSSHGINDDIGNLVHLRYLRLRGTHFNKLPKEIGNLRFLQTLDIKQTRIKEVPSTVVNLTQLMCLMVDRKTKLPNGIGNIESLDHLSEIDISLYPSLMKELNNLHKLRVLEVSPSTCEKSKEKSFLDYLGYMEKLETLNIFALGISVDFMLDVDWALQELKKSTVSIRRKSEDIFNLSPWSVWAEVSPLSTLPKWINSSLRKLSYLSIIVRTLRQEDLEVLGDLPALYSLDLQVTDALEERLVTVGHSGANDQSIAFQYLANFNFTSPAMVLVFGYGAMQRLQLLSFRFQLKATKNFHSGFDMGFENLTSLKAVHFGIDCRCARLWEVQTAEAALRNAINLNLNCPTLDLSRHFERLMYWDGMEEIPDLKIFKEENVGLAKIGPWGGNRGRVYDIHVAPHRLESIKVCSDISVIHSFEFTYSDHNGQKHVAGPWGGYGSGNVDMIQLAPSEFLLEVSGTFGRFRTALNVMTSLTFVTNAHSYGPYGKIEGTPFHMPVQSNGCIVGFFGRAGWYVDAIGIYVNPKLHTVKEKDKFGLAKIGPCGGNGGKAHDIKVFPHRLESVTICSDIVVNSLGFSYNDHDGEHHTAGPWGGQGGNNQLIQFDPEEFITSVCGTIGSYNTSFDVITSITLVTNIDCYGPFGQENGIPFHFPIQGNGSIVGFFGHADIYVDAIGVYVTPWIGTRTEEENEEIVKIGSFGRRGGRRCDIKVPPHRLESVTISSKIVINSLTFSYRSHDGQQHILGPWGSGNENNYTINLGPSEFLTKVLGTFGQFDEFPIVITSLTFFSNTGHQYGPFGQGGGTPFHAPISGNGSIVGFFGYQGDCVEAIGFYFRPS